MDLVSFEDAQEWQTLRDRMAAGTAQDPAEQMESDDDDDEGKYFSVWTSGRLCDFDGCERASHVKPVNDKGWFWAANNRKLSRTSCVSDGRGCFHA